MEAYSSMDGGTQKRRGERGGRREKEEKRENQKILLPKKCLLCYKVLASLNLANSEIKTSKLNL